jgi:hypothetical protein
MNNLSLEEIGEILYKLDRKTYHTISLFFQYANNEYSKYIKYNENCISNEDSVKWYLKGKLHREDDKPAIISISHLCELDYRSLVLNDDYDSVINTQYRSPVENIYYYKNGKKHRTVGPACIEIYHPDPEEPPELRLSWYKNGVLHRTDGPAIIYTRTKSQMWYVNGKLHRINDLPAVINNDSNRYYKAWYINGELFRTEGPVITTYKKTWTHIYRSEGYLNNGKVIYTNYTETVEN